MSFNKFTSNQLLFNHIGWSVGQFVCNTMYTADGSFVILIAHTLDASTHTRKTLILHQSTLQLTLHGGRFFLTW